MANRIQIRHGSTEPTTNNLLPYELGWDGTNLVLYINNNGTINPIDLLRNVGKELASGSNIDTIGFGNFYSPNGTRTDTLTGTPPVNGAGFRLFSFANYSNNYNFLWAFSTNENIKYRITSSSTPTWRNWRTLLHSGNYNEYALPLSGGTLTGNLFIEKAGDTYVRCKNSNTGNMVFLDAGSSTNCGIYIDGYYNGTNYTTDAKWMIYRNSSGNIIVNGHSIDDLPLTGGTLTGALSGTSATFSNNLTANTITISSTSGVAHLQFSRESYNYIIAPFANSGHLSLANSVSSSDIYYDFTNTAFSPGTTNTYTLGTSSKKWNNVYATTFTGDVTGNVTGDVTGNASSSTYAAYVRVTDTTPTSATYYYPNFTTGKTSGTNFALRANGSLRFYLTADGTACHLTIGASGTTSRIRAYNTNGKYCDLLTQGFGANRTLYFADRDGYGVVAESSRKIWVTTSATKPSNAVAGDIVLVKI